METTTIKKLRTAATVTVAGLMVAAAPFVGGLVKAHAEDANPAPAQEGLTATSWQNACIDAMDQCIVAPRHYEQQDKDENRVWHVFQYSDKVFTTNTVKVKSFNDQSKTIEEFSFDYDYRGDLGNVWSSAHREPNVEFFYNSHSHVLYIAGFGPDDHDYDTYNYPSPASDTIFEDTVEFPSGGDICIAENCQQVKIDASITRLGKCCFDKFVHTNEIDIANNAYSSSKLKTKDKNMCKWAVRKVGIEVGGCNMSFLDSFNDSDRNALLDKDGRIDHFGYTTVIFRGTAYPAVD